MWVQKVWERLVANDGARRSSIEEGRDTKRRVAAIWDNGSEVTTAASGKLTKTQWVISGPEQRFE